ncbi:MAG: ribosomal protein S18-alanine N-acetyltransferase [Thiohalocapsa sp.]|jgi:ribosomal-protein-alanine N-acetyltransferase
MVATTPDTGIVLRPMQVGDLPAVLAVERRSYSSPWTEAIFRDCLRVRYLCLVAERRRAIVAHSVLSVAAGECHVLNLCVDPQHRNLGIGRRLLRRMLALARRRDADTAFLEVRAGNAGALALYRSEGFDEVGRRNGYYPGVDGDPDRREDAVIMARAL